ncbi:MAG: hypothetical protein JO151_15820 [Verrucomicrobia bacterium]|nr:hypothetical protein [Verrucomicrobiota bacterium]
MKRGCFLFRIISFGALTLGLSLADQPSGQPSGQGLDENQTTSDHPADHMDGNHMDVNKEQADTMHPKWSDNSRASENSSQTGPTKKGMLPADRPGQDRPKAGQGLNENQTTGELPADHMDRKQKGLNKERADTMHPKSSDISRAAENSSQTSPMKKEMLPADRPGQDRPKAAQGLDENQTTSELPADHMDGKRKGVNKERADTKHSKWSDNSRASENSSQIGPMKKGILPAHRPGQDRPKQVANNHGVAGEKRVDHPQSKLPVVNDFHQPGLNQPSTAVAKDGLMMKRTRDPQEELTRRLPVGGGADPSLPGVVRSRGAATPIIGQLMPSRAKTSTAVINGTGMKRKP